MTSKELEDLVDARIGRIDDTLTAKGSEYAPGEDKLANFKKAGAMLGTSPEWALAGMLSKHLASIFDIIKAVDAGGTVEKHVVDEKITDSICYHILLEALLAERRSKNA